MNRLKIYILAFASFLLGTSENMIAGVLDKISDSLGTTLAATGQLITIYAIVYAIGTPILMAVTARMDRRKLIMYGLTVFVIGNLLAIVYPSYGMLVASRIITPLGAGVVMVTAMVVAAKLAPAGKQAGAIATVIMGFTGALILGVPIGRVITDVLNWQSAFGGIALLGLISMAVIYPTISGLEGDKPVPLLKQLALFKNLKVSLGLAISFFWLGGYSIVFAYLSPYLLNVSGISENLISTAFFIFGIASLFGSKLGGFSTDRWGAPVTLTVGMILQIIMLILLSLVTNTLIGVLTILALWSLFTWSSGPSQQFLISTLEPESSAVLSGLNQSMLQLAMAAGAGIGGIVVAKVSISVVPWIGALGIAIAIPVILIVSSLLSKNKMSESHLNQ
ncbi:MFS transporter [uncultured Brevibacillus sp.]|uniref:MFS transporter n=1 Tax=uncultured Brevibacillus sp. TaxID=169970 RepID=UPI002594AC1B|nr:MFS transporter [uncultured Brevibacillus sp.]